MPCLRRVGQGRPAARCAAACTRAATSDRWSTSSSVACVSRLSLRRSRQRRGGLGVVDLVALIDAAIFLELVSLEQLEVIARTRRPGGRRLRAALPLVDGRAQSLWESLLRLLHVVCDIEVEPQWKLVRRRRSARGQADLWVVGTTALHEFDGDEHEKAQRRVHDRRRDRRVDRAGIRAPRVHRRRRHPSGGDRSSRMPIGRSGGTTTPSYTGVAPAPSGLAVHPRGRLAFLGRIPVAPPRRRTA